MDSEHIKVENLDGRTVVTIDDWELFDYVDDFLTEHGIEYDYFTEADHEGRRNFTMHFSPNMPTERVSAILARISPEEVQRIWNLNNS
ncbi:MAG: hypothetical protein ACE5JQ_03735 [Candidatus Methylomirabilales bacterium]